MKKIFFLIACLVLLSVNLFAQEATQKRSLSIYLDAVSGQITPSSWKDKDGKVYRESLLFEGNEYSFGIRYSQNFKSIPWLSVGGTFDTTWNYNPVYTKDKKFVGYQPGKAPVGLKANAWVAVPYFMLLLDTRGLMGVYVNWSKSFGQAGTLGLGAELEYFFTGSPTYGNGKGESYNASGEPTSANYIVDYFGLLISYSISLPKGFAFNSTLNPRMDANRGNGWQSVEKNPANSLRLRWNNTVSLSVDGWSGYIQLRYEAYNLAHEKYKVANMLQILAGMSLAFDMSSN